MHEKMLGFQLVYSISCTCRVAPYSPLGLEAVSMLIALSTLCVELFLIRCLLPLDSNSSSFFCSSTSFSAISEVHLPGSLSASGRSHTKVRQRHFRHIPCQYHSRRSLNVAKVYQSVTIKQLARMSTAL